MNEIVIYCPACDQPVLPEEAFVVETDEGTLVFHKSSETMCPFVWSCRKLEKASRKLGEILDMFEKP